MNELYQPEEIAVYNQNALEELAWAIENSGGSFKLFFARCNYTNLRSRLAKRLQEVSTVQIQTLELKPSEQALYTRIQAEIGSEMPAALMVFGLETVTDLDRLLSSLNQVREEFLKNCHFPLILWINDEILKRIMRVAPDFESWATTTEFKVDRKKLKNYITITSNRWLTNQFKHHRSISLSQIKTEIESIERDLRNNQPVLEPKMQAILASLMGAVQLSNNQRESALEHYQTALRIWQQLGNLEYQAKILTGITLCYYQQAMRHQKDHESWKITQDYLDRSLAVLKQLKQPGLYISSLLDFSRILRQVQGWDKWELVVRKLLIDHENENNLIAMAQDYAFLAEATFAKKDLTSAKHYAELSLEILTPNSSQASNDLASTNELTEAQSFITYIKSLSRFILAKSHKKLGQLPTAISHLEKILETVSVPEYDPQLFLDILNYLRELYLAQKQYLPAFEIKLKRQSIEQQYGLRAFVGAGRIQPQRKAKLILTQVDSQAESIASEIEASGRYRDLEKLIKRIGDSGCKLLIIHGQSGVGKSSLVQGGLVPALKQTSLGIQDYLPVLVNVYTNWVTELGRVYVAALASKKNELTTALDSATTILEQLRASESRNLRSVLIFDQFEEFFFAESDANQRRQFFNFLGDCLNILQMKVILCLREDYLHYLLECNRLESMKVISQDILSKNVLYSLGTFSSEDAEAIIQRLTERSNFFLEPALIKELVRDLADDLEEVRPIELQVVGAQLQAESITKLAEYRARGPKQELVKRYLAAVISDCGAENQQLAEWVLFLLTNEKGTRPLKTREAIEIELNKQLPSIEASQLDLVLNIFVGCGMVLLFKESQADRYQLVHDYLAVFIYEQQKSRLENLVAALEIEQEKRQKAENQFLQADEARQIAQQANQKANQLIRVGSIFLIMSLVGAVATGVFSFTRIQDLDKQQELTKLDRDAFKGLKQFEFQSIESLLSAMQTAQDLKKALIKQNLPLEKYPTAAPAVTLQIILDNIRERNQLTGHQEYVKSANFSPDGQLIVTASDDKTAKIWDLSGSQIAELKGHQDIVNSANFSPNNQLIVTASWDKTAKIWDLSGNQIAELKGHQDIVNNANFSPDGQLIVTASADKTTRIWDLSGNQIAELQGHESEVYSANFSSDGQLIVTASKDKTARTWDLSGNQIAELKGHESFVNSANFSPDSQLIVTASADKTARIWDLSGNQIAKLKGHENFVNSANFSPNNQRIVTASGENSVRIWDLSGNQIAELKGHQDIVNSANFSPDGQRIVTASKDKTARIWDSLSNQIAELKGHQEYVSSANFSPDGQRIVTASWDKTARIWDLSGKQIAELKGHQNFVHSANFSSDGQRIVTTSWDKTARIWDLSGQQMAELKGHDRVFSANFSPDGQRIVTASGDKTARIWDLSGNQIAELKGHEDPVFSANFSPDGQRIVTASGDKTARIWDLSGNQIAELKGHQKRVNSAIFSPDGQRIVTASWDKTARIWDLSGQQIAELKGHQEVINSAISSPDGQQIVTASLDKTARIWDLSGRQIAELKGHESSIYSANFSPDGQRIVTASLDKTARIWDLSGKQIAELKGHENSVNSANFSPDGQRIVTTSRDSTARIWRVDKNLDQLLFRSCQWLNDYLITHPQELLELEICQDKPRLKAAVTFLVEKGERLAREGKIDEAVADFETALKLQPDLQFNPMERARQLAKSSSLVKE